ncbi:MAG: bifunctional phosphoglucose/phosphomannose isomerase [Bacteroidetes bacterium]|nr:bifunctional phosphoglucose/phosphomannose isomerase [Bacteroidota bacterium]
MTMQNLVERFPEQLDEAVSIFRAATLREPSQPFVNVVIAGLGGSGIGGTIVSDLAFDSSPIPVTVTKGYFIPAFTSAQSLVVISSYSGNTEETIACFEQARSKGAHIVCITSGGRVADMAREGKEDLLLVPGGMPPRACLGYSLVQLLGVFSAYGLLPATSLSEVSHAGAALRSTKEEIAAAATTLANDLNNRVPVIYSTTHLEGVAIRLRQQINENAKMLCWHHVIPEMNHNELVGWAGGNDQFAVVLLRDPNEYERNNYRIDINKNIIIQKTANFFEVTAQGQNPIAKALWLIHFGDWLSVILADLRGVDAIEVNVINYLKNELSKK